MTLLVKVCALALAAALFGLFLRAQQSALTLPLQIAAVAVILLTLFLTVGSRFSSFFSVLESSSLPAVLPETLLKGAAVCLASEFCAALCRESGSAAAADVVAFAGLMLTVVLCLPLCEKLIEVVRGLISP